MRLLIIGDLGGQLIPASKLAVASGAKVVHAPSFDGALSLLRDGKQIDLIFIDVDLDIAGFIGSLRRQRINVPVVACGIEQEARKAAKAIEAGAHEYLPLPPQAELIAAILEAIAKSNDDKPICAQSSIMQQVLKVADKVADTSATILITGESGTGKEVMARYIHEHSKRGKSDFIAINCAAIPDNLLESELFGHEKGAFTGAVERRIGKFEAANGSTILLDEISEMDLHLQAKLLRVLQEREIVRIGGNTSVKLDVRVIATTNRNLTSYVSEGKFREDLFYRLNVITLELPPLRERKADIPALIEHFVQKYARLNAIEAKPLSPAAFEKLLAHNWPGNIRELENCIHRALLLCNDAEITEHDAVLVGIVANDGFPKTLAQVERNAILSTVEANSGDELKASMVLGISVRALKAKLKEYASCKQA